MLSPDQIVSAIRSGKCRKIRVPGFQNASYFADADGHIYSLNNPAEPKHIDPKQGNGLMWVMLFEQEGLVKKLMVGDIIAHTFLGSPGEDESLSTVMYEDGDPTNNAAKNLEWATAQEQQRMLREKHFQKDRTIEPTDVHQTMNGNGAAHTLQEIPFVHDAEVDPLLDQLHAIQKKLDAEERQSARLRDALAPFATFHLSPAHATALAKTVVAEANRGGNHHSVLTVQDFREAKAAFERTTGEST